MDTIREQLPEECHATWDEMMNFDPRKFYTAERLLTIAEWKGHKMQPSFPADTTKFAFEEWEPREGDVFISAFPKTGLNWTNEIVKQLLYFEDEKSQALVSNLPLPFSLLEAGFPGKFEIFDGLPLKRRKQCTHLPATLVNVEKIKKVNAKVVYVLRNPKDQTVSWFKFIPKLPYLQLGPFKELYCSDDWEKFLDNYTSGKMHLAMKKDEWYLDHILTWLSHRDNKNVMFFFYEDMKKDLVKEVKRMAKFLEINLSDDNLRTVAEMCEFSSMKKTIEEGKSNSAQIKNSIGIMRKGQVGGWKDQFTVAQSEAMDKLVDEKLGQTDIHFTYEL